MAYAYIDNSGASVLHIVDDKATAQQYAKDGKIVETDAPHRGGYPYVIDEHGQVQEIVDENGRAYEHGNIKNGVEIPTPEFIQSMVDQLK